MNDIKCFWNAVFKSSPVAIVVTNAKVERNEAVGDRGLIYDEMTSNLESARLFGERKILF